MRILSTLPISVWRPLKPRIQFATVLHRQTANAHFGSNSNSPALNPSDGCLQRGSAPPHGPYHRPTPLNSLFLSGNLSFAVRSLLSSSPLYPLKPSILSTSHLPCALFSPCHHKGKNHLGMETIKIPSPSTILDSTEPAPGPTRGKPTKPAPRFTQKPKQTKSRNGTSYL